MYKITEEKYKQQLLKDYYKLMQMLEHEKKHNRKLEIVQDIISISCILDDYFFVKEKSYNYVDFRRKADDLISEVSEVNNIQVEKTIKTFEAEYSVHKNIIINSKELFNKIRCSNHIASIEPTEINKKEYYECLLSIPDKELVNHMFRQFQNKNIITFNFGFGENSNYEQDGVCYDIVSLNKYYHLIEVNKCFTYFSMFAIIHETSHSFVGNKYGVETFFHIYKEIMPFLNELKFMDYLNINDIGHDDSLINFNNYIKFLKRAFTKSSDVLNSKDVDVYSYIIGPLLAFYFYELEKNDPELFKKKLDFFYSKINQYEPIKLIKKINIDIEELTSGEVARRLIKKYTNSRKKFKS